MPEVLSFDAALTVLQVQRADEGVGQTCGSERVGNNRVSTAVTRWLKTKATHGQSIVPCLSSGSALMQCSSRTHAASLDD